MNGGGAKRFMARLIASGLKVDWLVAIQTDRQPARKSGLKQGPIQQLHDRGVICKDGEDRLGTQLWTAGPFLQDYLHYASTLSGFKQ